jgi:hypothetical protein
MITMIYISIADKVHSWNIYEGYQSEGVKLRNNGHQEWAELQCTW